MTQYTHHHRYRYPIVAMMMMLLMFTTLTDLPTTTAALSTVTITSFRSKSSLPRKQASTAILQMSGGGSTTPAPPPPLATLGGDVKSPKDIYDGIVNLGIMKSQYSIRKTFQLGMVAGVHIAIGSYLALSVGGNVPALAASHPGLQKLLLGAIGLPTGLIMTLITGGELFTGNAAILTTSYMEKKVTKKQLLLNWFVSYLGNFVGSLWIALLAYRSGTLPLTAGGPVAMATAKVFGATFQENMIRGILCNFLVCIAVYMASGCTTMISKMTAVWFPISAFVALGLEHSVANMFIIPYGMLRGATITIPEFLYRNLLPVTIGNIIGGAFLLMMPLGVSYGTWFQKKE